jgi:hypothetical protein
VRGFMCVRVVDVYVCGWGGVYLCVYVFSVRVEQQAAIEAIAVSLGLARGLPRVCHGLD